MMVYMGFMEQIIQEYRIMISRAFGAMIVLTYLITGPAENWNFITDMTVDLVSFVLVLIATFGRLWTLAYISGNKTKNLVTEGPYSVVRNPLYLFSFIGAIGIGLVSKNILILSIIGVMFVVYYPFVIRAEEKNLLKTHGRAFEEYRARTPMFIPRPSLYHDLPMYTINTRLFRRSFFSVMWFPLVYLILLIFERFHDVNLL